ncbi:MAG: GNAT family N-acetyltransferase [Clostridiales bacterium]|nr:GNAT family N-acetyltransferase [Clostridiales bacterium]MBQ2818276.1 GNAT family N-acetyltransferase [Clostridia bacterium]
MKFVKVTDRFKDMDQLDKLNIEAFPEDERIPLPRMLEMCRSGRLEIMAFYDEEFVGFAAVSRKENTSYLFYLAVKKEFRSKGYGGKILKELLMIYPGSQIVVDMEVLDSSAENAKQREDRRRFYLKNDFIATGYLLTYHGITFEVMCSGEKFDKEGFKNLIDGLRNPHFLPVMFKG